MKNVRFIMLIISVLLTMKVVAQEQTDAYYEPELLMVSQPKMELYTANDEDYVMFYYDVKNIGSETYKGDFIILMEPDVDHYYVKKSIKIKAGEIKRVKMEMDLGLIYYDSVYSVLPVYEYENQWYPLTAYEQFKSIALCLNAPLNDVDYVVTTEPAPVYDYYYDVRLQRPPVYGYYYVTPPPGWAYAYGYNPCCCYNNYVVFNGNNCYYNNGVYTGGVHVEGPINQTITTTVSNTTSAPRVSGNRYYNSAAASGSSSRRNGENSGSTNVSSSGSRSSRSSSSSGVSTSGSRSASSSSVGTSSSSRTSSSSTRTGTTSNINSSNSSSSRQSSTVRTTNSNSSSAISNSSSSRSSSSRSTSGNSSSSSSSSRSSSSSSSSSGSSSSSSRSGGGRR